MFIIKVVGDEHINLFSADNFEIYVGKIKLHRTMVGDILEVPLEKNDIIYVMDDEGNTVDSLSPRLNPYIDKS